MLRFRAPASAVDVSCWLTLSQKKVDEYKLREGEERLWGTVHTGRSSVHLSASSFTNPRSDGGRALDGAAERTAVARSVVFVPGTLRNVNTMRTFKEGSDKPGLLRHYVARLLVDVVSGKAVRETERLARFLLLSFADVKAHVFTYWAMFPAVAAASPMRIVQCQRLDAVPGLDQAQRDQFAKALVRYRLAQAPSPFGGNDAGESSFPAAFAVHGLTSSDGEMRLLSLEEALAGGDGMPLSELVFVALETAQAEPEGDAAPADGMADATVGHFVRNLALLLSLRCDPAALDAVHVLSLRGDGPSLTRDISVATVDEVQTESSGADFQAQSRLFTLDLQGAYAHVADMLRGLDVPVGPDAAAAQAEIGPMSAADEEALVQRVKDALLARAESRVADGASDASAAATARIKLVGWEPNARGKLGARQANLHAAMDPEQLAAAGVDLNVRLMTWRLMPNLQASQLQDTSCLLLGAGTLGCNVARTLLGWGVRRITFVDNGTVSYSNPVRQSLFEFEDCLDGGKPKAQAAADRLKRIFPGVESQAVHMDIPMAGHAPPTEEAKVKLLQNVDRLHELIASHDLIFCLVDTREARWLPAVASAALDKPQFNAAIGFESFLALRHGHSPLDEAGAGEEQKGEATRPARLGCYFCNDIISPQDSTKDRTIDQQCTVTRPGLALMAAATVVEMAVNVVHHPVRHRAPAPSGDSRGDPAAQEREEELAASSLGVIPHMVRGFLHTFTQIIPRSSAYEHCTACSRAVVQEYARDRHELVLRACTEERYLEDLSGLSAMKAALESVDFDVDFEEDWADDDDDDADATDKGTSV